jgi:hypothetical protein
MTTMPISSMLIAKIVHNSAEEPEPSQDVSALPSVVLSIFDSGTKCSKRMQCIGVLKPEDGTTCEVVVKTSSLSEAFDRLS